MTIAEKIKKIEGVLPSMMIPRRKQWEKVNKESEAEIDDFCRRNHIEISGNPAKEAWQEYKKLARQIDGLKSLIAENGESRGDVFGAMSACDVATEAELASVYDRISELEARREELKPLAREWGVWTRDPEFV